MFRLNILQGLPVLAESNENCFITDFRHKPEKVPTWIFQEHTFVVPQIRFQFSLVAYLCFKEVRVEFLLEIKNYTYEKYIRYAPYFTHFFVW